MLFAICSVSFCVRLMMGHEADARRSTCSALGQKGQDIHGHCVQLMKCGWTMTEVAWRANGERFVGTFNYPHKREHFKKYLDRETLQ